MLFRIRGFRVESLGFGAVSDLVAKPAMNNDRTLCRSQHPTS